jgi:polyhydroxyalkanoate synthesis regulator phasin
VDGVPVGLVGRVPTNISVENGVIRKGDFITSAANGKGQLATKSGPVLGIAMEDALEDGQIDVFVNLGHWYAPLSIDLTGVLGGLGLVSADEEVVDELVDEGTIAPNEAVALDQAPENPEGENETLVSEEASEELITVLNESYEQNQNQEFIDEILRGFSTQQQSIDEVRQLIAEANTSLESLENSVLTLQSIADAADSGALVGDQLFEESIRFTSTATFDNPIIQSGNSAGVVVLPAGQLQVQVFFTQPFAKVPRIGLTPYAFASNYRVTGVTTGGFVVEVQEASESSLEFSWTATVTAN